MNKNIMILGCQRSGKTTLANMICDRGKYSIFSVDALIYAFENTIPETGINKRSKIDDKSKVLTPFVASYFENIMKNYPNQNFILECCQLLPRDVVKEDIFKNFNIVCLGYPNATPEEIKSNIRENDKLLDFSYSKTMTDEYLNRAIPCWIEYSKNLQRVAKKLSIPFYETNNNREKTLEKIADSFFIDYER